MSYDGSIKIDTSIDTKPFESGCSKLQSAAKTSASAVSSAFKVATAAIVAVGTGLAGVGTLAINTGIEFESAFAGVKKTVTATDEQLETLRDDILEMSKTVPQSASALAEIGEAAGQLGIKTDNIKDFTRVMADLGVATNMTSTEAATALARVANITGMPQTEFDKLGSTIVALGNNLATTEKEIVDMSLRLAGAGTQVGLTESDILSFAGALSSVGIEAEAGGTAFSTVMSRMSLAVAQGGEELSMFADVAGMTSDEFKTAFETNAAGAIISFIKGLDNINKSGGSAIGTLEEMELSDIRMRDALLRAANASDIFSDAIDLGAEAWQENNALTKEAEQRYETLESKLQLLKNRASILGIAFKDSIDDQLRSAVDQGIGYLDELIAAFESGGLPAAVNKAGDIFAEIAVKASQDAPKMVDAAVEFIQAFIDGISKNHAKLQKAAADFVKSLVDGIVKLLPKEVQKPVKQFVDTITKSFQSGGLKKAVNTVQNIIKNLGKVITNITKVVLPPLAKILDKVADNLDILLPLATGLYAAFKAYSIVRTITSYIQGLSVASSALAVAEAAGTTATTAASGALTAKQVLVGVLTGKITLATAAQWAWNVAMNANPIGLVIAAVAALTAGLAALYLSQQQEVENYAKLSEEEQKLIDKVNEETEAYKNLYDAKEENIADTAAEFDYYEELAEELQKIVGKNGEIKDGYQERAKFIAGELSDAMGDEIEIVGNTIIKYDELIGKIDEVLKVKRAEAMLSANEDMYTKAIQNRTDAFDTYHNALEAVQNSQQKIEDYQERYNLALRTQSQVMSDPSSTNEQQAAISAEVSTAKAMLEGEKTQIVELESALKNAETSYVGYMSTIQNYEGLSSALISKDAEAINLALRDLEAGFISAEVGTQQTLSDQVTNFEEHYKNLKQALKDGAPGVTQEMVDQAHNMCENAKNEYALFVADAGITTKKAGEKAVQGLYETSPEFKGTAKEMAEGAKKELESADTESSGRKQGEKYVVGVSRNKKSARSTGKDVANETKKGTESVDAEPSGNNFIQGFIDGLWNGVKSVANAAMSVGQKALEAFKKVLGIESPSKETKKIARYFNEGLLIGLNQNKTQVINTTAEIADGMLYQIKKLAEKRPLQLIDTEQIKQQNALVARMRAAVYGNQAAIASAVTAQVNHNVRVENGGYNQERVVAVGTVNAPISIDGREIAIATAPFMAEELAFT